MFTVNGLDAAGTGVENKAEDIIAMRATRQEIRFVRPQLSRIAQREPERAAAMRTPLDEWEARLVAQEQESRTSKPPRRGRRP